MKQKDLQHVFIIGCKGIPARYGGFETFVDRLTAYQKDRSIRYHVACACEPEAYRRENARFTYHGADCVTFPWHKIGPARAVTYDLETMKPKSAGSHIQSFIFWPAGSARLSGM